ncbi:hypothetical protein Y695_02842 [Hydrogenophaga sp. T4]|nr:hypothetical protein Y695_02842 [Hydrogenophaga sp. T4]
MGAALAAKAGPLHIGDEGVQAIVVETQPVDQGVGLGQSEHARLGVAGLRFGRDRAHFDKSEAHGSQAVDTGGIFVQPRSQTDPVGEVQAGQGDRIVDPGFTIEAGQWRVLQLRDAVQREFVGGLGVQAKEEGACDSVGQEGHWIMGKFFVTADCLK